jgi:hypothetical protein
VASALGVTPGTATTMVKALAESLAEYEPYGGVRSAPGESSPPRAAAPPPGRGVSH